MLDFKKHGVPQFSANIDDAVRDAKMAELAEFHNNDMEYLTHYSYPLLWLLAEVILQCERIGNTKIGTSLTGEKTGVYTARTFKADMIKLYDYTTSVLHYAGFLFEYHELLALEFNLNKMASDVWNSHGGSAERPSYAQGVSERIKRTAQKGYEHQHIESMFDQYGQENPYPIKISYMESPENTVLTLKRGLGLQEQKKFLAKRNQLTQMSNHQRQSQQSLQSIMSVLLQSNIGGKRCHPSTMTIHN
jgi:hypothetical protein